MAMGVVMVLAGREVELTLDWDVSRCRHVEAIEREKADCIGSLLRETSTMRDGITMGLWWCLETKGGRGHQVTSREALFRPKDQWQRVAERMSARHREAGQ